VRQRDFPAAERCARRLLQVVVRVDTSELGALDQAVEERSCGKRRIVIAGIG